MSFEKGTLWNKIIETTKHALSIGAQFPIPTDYEFIEDSGVKFFVRKLASLQKKDEEKRKQILSRNPKNPFLPYDKELFVSEVSDTHVALLNKFNVVENHLLIITKHFEEQETLLTLKDFEALWLCMNEYKSLGFYNGGIEAGASQKHKHLQIVPLPLAPEGPQIPIEPLLKNYDYSKELGTITSFPFKHVFGHFKENIIKTKNAANIFFNIYSKMLEHAGMGTPDIKNLKYQSKPYCLLITNQWMLLVPRFCEFFDSISINSLGFAGALLVKDEFQMEVLKKTGPMKVLQQVAFPR